MSGFPGPPIARGCAQAASPRIGTGQPVGRQRRTEVGRVGSRFDVGDEFDPLAYGRWEHNLKAAVNGKRGQAALRYLEKVLVEMPNKRLIRGWLAVPDGDCCAVGAYAAAKSADREGISFAEGVKRLAESIPAYAVRNWDQVGRDETGEYRTKPNPALGGYIGTITSDSMGDGENLTEAAGVNAGLVRTLAWTLGDLNDNEYGHGYTPEQRYVAVLAWVRRHIKATS